MKELIRILKANPEIGQALAVLVGIGILTPGEVREYFKIGEKEFEI